MCTHTPITLIHKHSDTYVHSPHSHTFTHIHTYTCALALMHTHRHSHSYICALKPHSCISSHILTHAHMHSHSCTLTPVGTHAHTYMHSFTHSHIHKCTHIHTYTSALTYIHVLIAHLYIFIHWHITLMYTHAHKHSHHTHIHSYSYTHTLTHSHIFTHMHSHTHTCTPALGSAWLPHPSCSGLCEVTRALKLLPSPFGGCPHLATQEKHTGPVSMHLSSRHRDGGQPCPWGPSLCSHRFCHSGLQMRKRRLREVRPLAPGALASKWQGQEVSPYRCATALMALSMAPAT